MADNNIIGSEDEENASERIVETLSSLTIGGGYTRTEAPEIRATSVSILEGDSSASVLGQNPSVSALESYSSVPLFMKEMSELILKFRTS